MTDAKPGLEEVLEEWHVASDNTPRWSGWKTISPFPDLHAEITEVVRAAMQLTRVMERIDDDNWFVSRVDAERMNTALDALAAHVEVSR